MECSDGSEMKENVSAVVRGCRAFRWQTNGLVCWGCVCRLSARSQGKNNFYKSGMEYSETLLIEAKLGKRIEMN